MKKKKDLPKPRNEFVAGLRLRGGKGAHGKTKKAIRKLEKQKFTKEIFSVKEE